MRIGIDVGGTDLSAALIDKNGVKTHEHSAPTYAARTSDDISAIVTDTVDAVIESSGISLKDIEFMGIGVPGRTDIKTGTAIMAGNLPFDNTCFGEIFQRRYGVRSYLDNDANCAAWGEYLFGGGKGSEVFVMITLGTGIGGGAVINGKLLHGVKNRAAELGHQVIDMNGAECECGRRGCFETVASTKALVSRVRASAERNPNGTIAEIIKEKGVCDGRTLFYALDAGDAEAKRLFDEYINFLYIGVSNIIWAFRPELMVIGGGIAKEGERIIKPLREAINYPECRIEASRLKGDAGLIGAAMLDIERQGNVF